MTDWDLLTPGIGLSSLGIVTVGISLSGIAKTFIEGMHAVGLLTLFIGMIFLASGLFKDGFPSSGRAKSATFITLGFLVTFGFASSYYSKHPGSKYLHLHWPDADYCYTLCCVGRSFIQKDTIH